MSEFTQLFNQRKEAYPVYGINQYWINTQEHGTRNTERGTRNTKRRTQNAERGTQNIVLYKNNAFWNMNCQIRYLFWNPDLLHIFILTKKKEENFCFPLFLVSIKMCNRCRFQNKYLIWQFMFQKALFLYGTMFCVPRSAFCVLCSVFRSWLVV